MDWRLPSVPEEFQGMDCPWSDVPSNIDPTKQVLNLTSRNEVVATYGNHMVYTVRDPAEDAYEEWLANNPTGRPRTPPSFGSPYPDYEPLFHCQSSPPFPPSTPQPTAPPVYKTSQMKGKAAVFKP